MKNIEIAKRYFDLSNKSDLENVEKMFRESSTYSSQNTGIFLGKESIMKMMNSFFDSFKILFWEVKSIEEVSENIFLFDFIFHWEKILKNGLEYVVIFDKKIQHIEINNKK